MQHGKPRLTCLDYLKVLAGIEKSCLHVVDVAAYVGQASGNEMERGGKVP